MKRRDFLKTSASAAVAAALPWRSALAQADWRTFEITTRADMQTIVIGIKKMIVTSDALTEWPIVMATAMLAMVPPVAVVVFMQRWFVKGLVDTEK